MGLSDWSDKYRNVLANIPKEDDILTSLTGEAILFVEVGEGKPPFIYGRAFVPELPELEPEWRLQDSDHLTHLGLKCILMPKARAEVLRRCPIVEDKVKIKSLKVIRASQTNKSLLCEVAEFL